MEGAHGVADELGGRVGVEGDVEGKLDAEATDERVEGGVGQSRMTKLVAEMRHRRLGEQSATRVSGGMEKKRKRREEEEGEKERG